MKAKQLHEMIQNDLKPVVTFKKEIEDQESYIQARMRGRIVSSQIKHDDCFEFCINFTEFDEFNKQFESADYYDENRKPTLTARQAGFYNMTNEMIFFMLDQDVDDSLEIERDGRVKLFEKFTRECGSKTYVQWLEDQLI